MLHDSFKNCSGSISTQSHKLLLGFMYDPSPLNVGSLGKTM
ncbi:hypothetical protein JCM19237_5857 [Photobacterium aphoticum]|uniref:Uncharacterized protein n=1 Tax=Photobacterium aphoticum TaxID=754436 RepID=A0A090QME0_9GAMM|nr:hypothetical protein JCM19237_5857 [Photobacterium aphoticum]